MNNKSNSNHKLEDFQDTVLSLSEQHLIGGSINGLDGADGQDAIVSNLSTNTSSYSFRIVEDPNIFFPRIIFDPFQGFIICVPTSGKISTF